MEDITFQYVSDIHLEMCVNASEYIQQLQPHARFLILAGDIGNPYYTSYAAFVTHASDLFETVFLIAGNHEYYHGSCMIDTESKIRSIVNEIPRKNVVYLQNEVYAIPNTMLYVFGSTFWSYIPESYMKTIKASVNDYTMIPYLSPTDVNELHRQAMSSLKRYVEECKDKQWIVISHHIPKFSLLHENYQPYYVLNHAFASNVQLADDPCIIAWVYGHTHTPCQKEKFFCNPMGYPRENESIDMNMTFSISYTEE
jgi:predicted phosphodiesterase